MTDHQPLTKEEVEQAAARGAYQGMAQLLRELGVDTGKPLEMQRDFAHLRHSREGQEQITKWAKRGAIGAGVSGLAWILFEGVRIALQVKGGP